MRVLHQVSKFIQFRAIYPLCIDKSEQPTVEYFSKLDIRVGNIIQCWKHPQSVNLYCQKILLSKQPEIIREIGSGIQQTVPIDKMKGNVLVLANLKSRKLAGFASQGMLLCATTIQPQNQITCYPLFVEGIIGERVYLEGYEDLFQGKQLLKPVNPKKKIVEKCIPFFTTDAEGIATWKGIKLKLSTGYIKSVLINANIS